MLKIIKTYLLIFILYSCIFFLLLISSVFPNQQVLFYRGLTLFAISTLVTFLILFFLRKKLKNLTLETIINSIIFSLSIHLCFFVIFPVTFDRSVTMYLLNTINKNTENTCIQKDNIQQKLINEYIIEQKAVSRRINEQSIIDFINIDNDCIQLTAKSKKFLNFSSIIKKLYQIKDN